MKPATLLTTVALLLVLFGTVGCVLLSFGVRGGQVGDTLFRFPPEGRYQLIVRIGSDGRHWGGDVTRRVAINVWAHGTRTSWHYVRLVHIPLGERQEQENE